MCVHVIENVAHLMSYLQNPAPMRDLVGCDGTYVYLVTCQYVLFF